jgi:hypothetical protein
MAKSKSARYYASNPKARAKKKAYDTKYHSTEERKQYRRELARKRRAKKIMGKGGKDVSHTKGGGYKLESPSKNRARNGANGKSTKAPRRKK